MVKVREAFWPEVSGEDLPPCRTLNEAARIELKAHWLDFLSRLEQRWPDGEADPRPEIAACIAERIIALDAGMVTALRAIMEVIEMLEGDGTTASGSQAGVISRPPLGAGAKRNGSWRTVLDGIPTTQVNRATGG